MATKACPYCAEEIREEAVFCKHCATSLNEAGAPGKSANTTVKSDKVFGAAAGLLTGLGCGGGLVVLGLLISLTGIGAVIGVPLIILGLLMPVLAPMIGLAQVSGQCPHCSKPLAASTIQGAVTCAFCKKRVIIDKGRFVRVD